MGSNHRRPPLTPELGGNQDDNQSLQRLLSVFTNGIADERFGTAANVLQDGNLTVNQKLTKIDELIPFPPTASANQLRQMLGVSKMAVMTSKWWEDNRKGKKEEMVGRREDNHRKRAKQHQPNRKDDDDYD